MGYRTSGCRLGEVRPHAVSSSYVSKPIYETFRPADDRDIRTASRPGPERRHAREPGSGRGVLAAALRAQRLDGATRREAGPGFGARTAGFRARTAIRVRCTSLRGAWVRKPMDSRLRGNDSNCILDRHSRDSGNDAIDKAVVAATAVIPAKAGIHAACPNTNARTAGSGARTLSERELPPGPSASLETRTGGKGFVPLRDRGVAQGDDSIGPDRSGARHGAVAPPASRGRSAVPAATAARSGRPAADR